MFSRADNDARQIDGDEPTCANTLRRPEHQQCAHERQYGVNCGLDLQPENEQQKVTTANAQQRASAHLFSEQSGSVPTVKLPGARTC